MGRAVVLATHADAFLTGHEVSLDLENNYWFRNAHSVQMSKGHVGPSLATSGDQWLRELKNEGFTRAYLWVEPNRSGMETIQRLGFVGGEQWAAATSYRFQHVLWREKATLDRERADERKWGFNYGGYAVQDGQHSVDAHIDEAAKSLLHALGDMSEFGLRHNLDERWQTYFKKGVHVLSDLQSGAHRELQPGSISMFPEHAFPKESRLLVEAVGLSWVLGGAGSWNDWNSADSHVQQEFEKVTLGYYDAVCKCLYAACKV